MTKRFTVRAAMAACLIALMTFPPVTLMAEEDEALDFFLQEAEVVTATRRKQKVSQSPVTIEVIDAKTIKAMGALDLWDILRYAVGVDVRTARTVEGNRATVTVRGFQDELQASLQVLIDGRSVVSPVNGGVYWQQIPVQLQDIERIEIVRGPNSALFGSNAGLGVINIITKEPSAEAGLEMNGLAGRNGLYRSHVVGEGYGLRISASRNGVDGSPVLPWLTDDLVYDDSIQMTKLNLRGSYDVGENTHLDFSGGFHHDTRSIPTTLFGINTQLTETHYQMAKLSQAFSQSHSLDVQLSRNDQLRSTPQNAIREIEYAAELIDSFSLFDDHLQTVLGGSFRHISVRSPFMFNQWVNSDNNNSTRENRILRGFLSQSLQIADPVTLAWAGSIENSDTGGLQGAGQGSLLITPMEDHIIRFMAARSATVPSLIEVYADAVWSDFLPTKIIGNEGMNPAYINNFEVGLGGAYFQRRLTLDANYYYMEIDGLASFRQEVQGTLIPFPPFFIPTGVLLQPINANTAIARGGEFSGKYTLAPGRSVFVNYAQEVIRDRDGNKEETDGTPVHKLNAGVMARLAAGFSAAVMMARKSGWFSTSANDGADMYVEPYVRLDARLAWANDWLEIYVGGQDLLEERHREFSDYIDIITQYYGGATLRFGGSKE